MQLISDFLVSVIIPVYNGEKYLSDVIESVLNSSHKNIQLILVNDGSTDQSGEICKCYQKSDHRITYIEKTNGGVASARNAGLNVAKGDYICFADNDDIVDEEMYRILLNDCTLTHCDMAISNVQILMTDSGNVFPINNISQSELLNSDQISQLLLYVLLGSESEHARYKVNKTVWTCMFSKKFLDVNNLHFKNFISTEDDWIFLIEALGCARKVYLEKEYLYYWRIHSTQTTWHRHYIPDLPEKRQNHWNFVWPYIRQYDSKIQHQYKLFHWAKTINDVINNEIYTYEKEKSKSVFRRAIRIETKCTGPISKYQVFKYALGRYRLFGAICIGTVLYSFGEEAMLHIKRIKLLVH